ncbi:hypothetical protein LC55x_3506 [Lysobacter capsici]|jgi:hypothetical protein|uniref:hypothetical protein n=1 Tax=Lysobacter capsici TaxID=435897 RepID=UPI000720A807|nr:hypothetical protein [Lysobacter capsici]ALN86763.1 hypothetical protein LC55x_3506 [Lysobacter capsici]
MSPRDGGGADDGGRCGYSVVAVIALRFGGRMQSAAIGGVNAPLISIAAHRENEPEAEKPADPTPAY